MVSTTNQMKPVNLVCSYLCGVPVRDISGVEIQAIIGFLERGYEQALGWRDDLDSTIQAVMRQYIPSPDLMLMLADVWAELAYCVPHAVDGDMRLHICARVDIAHEGFWFADSLTPYAADALGRPDPYGGFVNWRKWAKNVIPSAPLVSGLLWSGRLGKVHARGDLKKASAA